jgi:predicted HTH transcriptional regulator
MVKQSRDGIEITNLGALLFAKDLNQELYPKVVDAPLEAAA